MSVLRFDPFRDPFRDFDRLTNQMLSGTRTPSSLPMDVWRSGEEYRVALDLPGVDPSTVEITVERGTLTVRAERTQGFPDEAQVLVAERPQGSFTRQLMLGEGVDQEQIQADYQNGVLQLTIPVAQAAQPRRISVGGGGGPTSISAGGAGGAGGQVVAGETVTGSGNGPTAGGSAVGNTSAGGSAS